MALPHAILASLCEQAGSGYELDRRFDRSIGYCWAATHQQIYRTPRVMEDDGWVHVEPVEQQGRPDKKVCRVTVVGAGGIGFDVSEFLVTDSSPTLNLTEWKAQLRLESLRRPSARGRRRHHLRRTGVGP